VRRFVYAFLFCFAASVAAISWSLANIRYEILVQEFDARPLNVAEKRILQSALAFQGFYSGLLDGKWGKVSQRGLENYARERFSQEPINAHIGTLVIDFLGNIDKFGWRMRYLPSIGLSVAFPEIGLSEQEQRDGALHWTHQTGSLSIVATRHSLSGMEPLHDTVVGKGTTGKEPYRTRTRDLWVTRVRDLDGKIYYVRSDLIGAGWSSVLVSARPADETLLNTVSASIHVGADIDWNLPASGYLRDMVHLTLEMLGEAKAAAGDTSPGPDGRRRSEPSQVATGSGFYINRSGDVLTNAHVVAACNSISANTIPMQMVAHSSEHDLAVLRPVAPYRPPAVARFSKQPAKLNSDVAVAGYPLHGYLGGLNITRGSVTSLVGLRGDLTRLQISAAVQSGSSGGPVVDKFGNVVGVVVSKLDALEIANMTGEIPQNINFSIRGEIAKLFLSSRDIDFEVPDGERELDPTVIARDASKYTVLIECR